MTDVCDRCHGLGWIGKARTPAPSMSFPEFDEPSCPKCGGEGRVHPMTEDEATHRLGEALAGLVLMLDKVQAAADAAAACTLSNIST
ncbi:MAG: hypothetical protein EON55_20035, partial [Alphaproteobacteria bacterium]